VKRSASKGKATVKRQRALQHQQEARRRAASRANRESREGSAVQAGLRGQPREFPAQHLEKPGNESDLAVAPRFLAPEYRGSDKLSGMVAIVTGGDSGIGRAVAVLFAREGADIGLVYLCEHEDAQRTKECVEAEGQRCVAIAGDVKDSAFCERVVREVVRTLGRLDVLVNNAAFQVHAESLEDITDEQLDETVRTNVCGYFYMARAAIPQLRAGASIINTGSVVGLEGSGHLLDYAATKGAIHAFTKSLAQNVLERGIRVNAIAPGPVWTPLNPSDQPAARVASFGQKSDMRRAAQPEELSPAYVFLASPVCSSYVTGIVLPITGSVGAI
jgi:NAD(P)-dependent dehydrogenase (short-subunit alcohol dehydrogenase family)